MYRAQPHGLGVFVLFFVQILFLACVSWSLGEWADWTISPKALGTSHGGHGSPCAVQPRCCHTVCAIGKETRLEMGWNESCLCPVANFCWRQSAHDGSVPTGNSLGNWVFGAGEQSYLSGQTG